MFLQRACSLTATSLENRRPASEAQGRQERNTNSQRLKCKLDSHDLFLHEPPNLSRNGMGPPTSPRVIHYPSRRKPYCTDQLPGSYAISNQGHVNVAVPLTIVDEP